MAKKNVFISVGGGYLDQHEKFLDALIDLLRSVNIEPRVMNKTDFPSGNPLPDILRVLRECDGLIVIAFERTYLESGLDKRKTAIGPLRYTTPWNQIEASMAYALALPTFVLMEEGLREEGLLEQKFDWFVDRVKISADALSDKGVRGRLMAWCQKVQNAKPPKVTRKIDETITIGELLQMLTMKTSAALVSALVVVFLFGLAMAHTGVGEGILKWAKLL